MSPNPVPLSPRPVAASVEELLAGAVRLGAHHPDDARSSALFERVELDGQRCIVKYVHPDHDFTMRVSGDIGCRPRRVWETGLMDVAPDVIDHATIGAAHWGRNGWGVALLMRDVSAELVPVGDAPIPEEHHLRFLEHTAAMSAQMWGWRDELSMLLHERRWTWFGPEQLDGERALGFPEHVPEVAFQGWSRFAERAPAACVRLIDGLRHEPMALSAAVRTTPQTFLHGDWKLGNLGVGLDGRTVLLDWAYPGEGPACHELAWYLALNRARFPVGHTKESTIEAFHGALVRHGIDTSGWWERQLGLCLLGGLVQFGWEKAFGDDDELAWWCAAAMDGERFL
ncbi:MAG: aminoglycoside phosphotransferase [Acidimicrobiales bacterium]|nr:aminoglycoside phosphotransferase [Acidimicrobiales bacterium]